MNQLPFDPAWEHVVLVTVAGNLFASCFKTSLYRYEHDGLARDCPYEGAAKLWNRLLFYEDKGTSVLKMWI